MERPTCTTGTVLLNTSYSIFGSLEPFTSYVTCLLLLKHLAKGWLKQESYVAVKNEANTSTLKIKRACGQGMYMN